MEWIVAGLIGLVGTLITAGITASQNNANNALQREQNQKQLEIAEKQLETNKEVSTDNLGLQKEQFDYQKQLNDLMMQREDTAMQRQIADLKAAGLSPLMASGGASTGNYISASAPQRDISGINSALSNILGVHQDYASRKQQAYMFERQQTMQIAQQSQDLVSSYLDNKARIEEIKGQMIANAYNAEHGLRDPSLEQAIIDGIMTFMKQKEITPGDVGDKITQGITDTKNKITENIDKSVDMWKDIVNNTKDVLKIPITSTFSTAQKIGNYFSNEQRLERRKNVLKRKRKKNPKKHKKVVIIRVYF